MRTTLYLVRHAATAANLAKPSKLQGRRTDPPLDPVGRQQAEATRKALFSIDFAASYSSPLLRARQTAEIIAPQITSQIVDGLTECDVGRWEGIDWDTIRETEPVEFAQYMSDPAKFGYAGGETFAEVFGRVSTAIDGLVVRHPGQTLLVVSHHVVNRTFLAAKLGLPLSRARQVALDNCGISVVMFEHGKAMVTTLNSTLHLGRMAA